MQARHVLMSLVRGYRLVLSPWLGNACRFEPTCSVYALEALERHGAFAGSALTVFRIARCQPFCAGGHDPVPAAGARLFTSLLPNAAPTRAVSPASPSDSAPP